MPSNLSTLGRSLSTMALPEGWTFHNRGTSDDFGLFLSHVCVDFASRRAVCDRIIALSPAATRTGRSGKTGGRTSLPTAAAASTAVRVEASCQLADSERWGGRSHSCASAPIFMSAQLCLERVEDVVNLLANPLCIPPCGGGGGGIDDADGDDGGTGGDVRTRSGRGNDDYGENSVVSSSTNAPAVLTSASSTERRRMENSASTSSVDELPPIKAEHDFHDYYARDGDDADDADPDNDSFDDHFDWPLGDVDRESSNEREGYQTSFHASSREKDASFHASSREEDAFFHASSREKKESRVVAALDPVTGETTSTADRSLPSLAALKTTDGLVPQAMRDLMSHKNQKTRNYSLDFKLTAVELIENGRSISGVSREIGVDKRCIRNWFNQRSEMREVRNQMGDSFFSSRKRLKGAGARRRFAKAEEELVRHIWSIKSQGLVISRNQMLEKMNQLITEAKLKGEIDADAKWKASSSWLVKFLKRHNFSLRPKITRKTMENLEDKICIFLAYVYKMRRDFAYPLCNIYNVDDIRVSFSSPSSISREEDEKIPPDQCCPEITVCLAASADGSRYKPLVVLKSDEPSSPSLPKDLAEGLIVTSNARGSVTPAVVSRLLTECLGKSDFADESLLLWDAAPDHLQRAVETELAERRLHVVNIPGGATRFLQPADNGWKQLFKLFIPARFCEWLKNEKNQGRSPSHPAVEVVLRWIFEAWSSVSANIVTESFKTTGISIALDGSEDERVDFFKLGQFRNNSGKNNSRPSTSSSSWSKLADLRALEPAKRPLTAEHREAEEDEKIILVADDDVMRFHTS